MATANTLYSNFVDAADVAGNIKNDKAILLAASTLANTIVRIGDSKFKAVYPFLGGIEFSHKFNFMNPEDSDSAFRLTFPNGMTHSANGIQGNGAGQYAETFLNPATSLVLNSTHLSIYSRTNNAGSEIVDMGASGNQATYTNALALYAAYTSLTIFDSPNRITATNTDSRGFYLGSRVSSSSGKIFKNGNLMATSTSNSGSLPSFTIQICRNHYEALPYHSNRNYAFASIGDGLTDKEAQYFSHQIKFIQGILGRQ